ncbi:hypothetical protein CROQUDRAFT_110388 [Cronartium quercuum f. sp. fusiforme G11]|uniref:Ubiquitin carboxyl-terminal hydrolase n=1 Tax=Cronartium quercuum f. sp. fusiforme G11 TaxID=708437 RepID=A0A9P6NC87_9BASI|nr:hypothetical protein CROQUDRAFT_110388 [Cronartium quercuum f. sp. fusiforme G11]
MALSSDDCVECPHVASLLPSLSLPFGRSMVYKEECTQCFDSQDSPLGIDVCLTCFNGGCAQSGFHHAQVHALKHVHLLALNIRRIRKPQVQRSPSAEPPLKKLAILEEAEHDQYDISTSVKCYGPGCAGRSIVTPQSISAQLDTITSAILASNSSARANEIEAWEEQIETCTHVTQLEQHTNHSIASQASTTCHACDMASNLWLCLQCGSLGCGRPQFGGAGGNGHALQHYRDTGHSVNVKLGTITAEGSADLYCYHCDDARTDSKLQQHLAHFGIEIAKQEKTERSMTELQVEQNLRFDFSMTGEDGRHLIPIHGPGLTGLKNLGNSCYIASVLQVLFALPPFKTRYYDNFLTHPTACGAPLPSNCLTCQMNKMAHGLLSGRYALPDHNVTVNQPVAAHDNEAQSPRPVFQRGISPMMLKALVGRGHSEFSTMRQQDAEEFLGHMFETIQRDAHQQRTTATSLMQSAGLTQEVGPIDPTSLFRFELEQKLECVSCQGVRYRLEMQNTLSIPISAIPAATPHQEGSAVASVAYQPITLARCLENFTTTTSVDYTCTECQVKTTALTSTRLASFPRYLLVHARRFEVVNWVPKKLEVPLVIEDQQIDLEPYLGCGLQPGEKVLLDSAVATNDPPVDQEMFAALEGMGFPAAKCAKAIRATGNTSVENATNWLFEHFEDAEDSDDAPTTMTEPHSPVDVLTLQDMGFTSNQAKKALKETAGNMERAVEWLFSHPDDDGSTATVSMSKANESAATNVTQYGDRHLPAKFRLKAFISHKGPSVHSGHYVAHLRLSTPETKSDSEWVFFNDEKVTKVGEGPLSTEALSPFAYLYLFERILPDSVQA